MKSRVGHKISYSVMIVDAHPREHHRGGGAEIDTVTVAVLLPLGL